MRVLTTGVRSEYAPRIFRGYDGSLVPHDEHPGRLQRILAGVRSVCEPEESSRVAQDAELELVHAPHMIAFFREMAVTAPDDRPMYPDSFPVRRNTPPADLRGRFGFYCTGTQTPFVDPYWSDALQAAGCALEGAELILGGERRLYLAIRPPGHHAGPDYFGGYCYLNNTALAAERLSRSGRVAVLDVDYHHGNGTQDCFYSTDAVLTVSLHADARFAYPHFSGSRDETGSGKGIGHNLNLPVPVNAAADHWFAALDEALARIVGWKPDFLVVAFGADTYRSDPVGGLDLDIPHYRELGARISSTGFPVLALQEGGYATDDLGRIVAELLAGLRG